MPSKPYKSIKPMFLRDNWKIVKGDLVEIIVGRNKGQQGKVLKVIRDKRFPRVVVEGCNLIKRALPKMSASSSGFTITMEGALHYSNVMLVDPVTGKPVRVAWQYLLDGTKVRVGRGKHASGQLIPRPQPFRKGDSFAMGPKDTSPEDVMRMTYNQESDFPASALLAVRNRLGRPLAQSEELQPALEEGAARMPVPDAPSTSGQSPFSTFRRSCHTLAAAAAQHPSAVMRVSTQAPSSRKPDQLVSRQLYTSACTSPHPTHMPQQETCTSKQLPSTCCGGSGAHTAKLASLSGASCATGPRWACPQSLSSNVLSSYNLPVRHAARVANRSEAWRGITASALSWVYSRGTAGQTQSMCSGSSSHASGTANCSNITVCKASQSLASISTPALVASTGCSPHAARCWEISAGGLAGHRFLATSRSAKRAALLTAAVMMSIVMA